MPAITPKLDPISSLARSVLELYTQELAEVHFPDLDLSTLQVSHADLQRAQCELEQAEAELGRAREALSAKAAALDATAERALAYARIYAERDAALAARVADVGRTRHLSSADGAPPAKQRGRRRKAEAPSDLFAAKATSELEAGALDSAP